MANRFLDTNYYKSPFVRSLKGPLKSLYSYIICDCDGAGIWHLDLEVACLYIGFGVTPEEFERDFVKTGKAIAIGQNRYFFPDFIEHQYPQGLIETNPAHKNFILRLKKFNLIDENLDLIEQKIEGASKGLSRPLGNGNVLGNVLGNGNCISLEEYEKPLIGVIPNSSPSDFAKRNTGGVKAARKFLSKDTELGDRMMSRWWQWFKGRNNNKDPKVNGRSGKSIKEIYKYFLSEGRKKEFTEEKLIYDYAFDEFSLILTRWEELKANNFLYSCVDITKISSNLTDIINFLGNGRAINRRNTNESPVATVKPKGGFGKL